MKEHPILFSTPMVRAILDDRKTQTRRVITPRWMTCMAEHIPEEVMKRLKYEVGDRLWVKETFAPVGTEGHLGFHVRYKADEIKSIGAYGCQMWKPSIFMARRHSRINLEINGVRIERLQDISANDAIDEGIDLKQHECGCEVCARATRLCPATQSSLIMEFAELWDSINGKKNPWEKNCWVWAISFKRL